MKDSLLCTVEWKMRLDALNYIQRISRYFSEILQKVSVGSVRNNAEI
jgi:hypothetical protein